MTAMMLAAVTKRKRLAGQVEHLEEQVRELAEEYAHISQAKPVLLGGNPKDRCGESREQVAFGPPH